MNRKLSLLFIVFFSFFLFMFKANAAYPLCSYIEYNNNFGEDKTASLVLHGSSVYLVMTADPNEFYNNVVTALGDVASSLNVGTISFLGSDSGSQYEVTEGTYVYKLGNGYRTATLLNDDGSLSDRNITVNWIGDYRSFFSSRALCPQFFISDGVSAIVDTASMEFRDDAGGVGINNVKYELSSSRFGTVGSENIQYLSEELNSCITSSDRISWFVDKFNMDLYSDDQAAQRKIAQFTQNNYGDLISVIKTKYVEGGECYNAHPEKQDEYSQLVSKVNGFTSIQGGGIGTQDVNSCDDIINGKFAQHLNSILKFIMYLGPILTIVLSSADYFKAMISNDSDAMKKVNSKTVVRVIAALLLFFIPLIIRVLLSVFGFDSSCSMIN